MDWQCLSRAPVQTALPDFLVVARAALVARAPQQEPPPAARIHEAAALNELTVDEQTATNGDCGPDALLRNLERLHIEHTNHTSILRTCTTRGREAALLALRQKLVAWLQQNASHELLPSLTVREWVDMDGTYGSFEHYLSDMRLPRRWIDTPMLYAASAALHMQIVCLLSSGEPNLIAARSVQESTGAVPVALIANIGNVQFWALLPWPTEDEPEGPEEPLDSQGDLLLDRPQGHGTLVAVTEEAGYWQQQPQPAAELPSDALSLGRLVLNWKPFGAEGMHQDIPPLAQRLEAAFGAGARPHTFQVLQWRETIKMLQWEEEEHARGIDRTHFLRIAAAH